MRRIAPSVLLVAIVEAALLFVPLGGPTFAEAREASSSYSSPAKDPVSAQPLESTVEFRVADPGLKPIPGARVAIVGQSGEVLGTGLTNSVGMWKAKITVKPDPRFVSSGKLGTVAALVTAAGYNEMLLFEVPVDQGQVQVQPVILNPIQTGQRNEPVAALGNIHRHAYMRLIDDYAQRIKLVRQPAIKGEQGYAPWDSNIR
ncbi:MAG: hypothetical protein ACYCVB_06195 [Bacilli bacterium]